MHKKTFIFVFFGTQLALLLLHLHKHGTFVHYAYAKQNNEQLLSQTKKRLQDEQQRLTQLEDLATIKTYAHTKFGMKPINRKQIKRIDHEQLI